MPRHTRTCRRGCLGTRLLLECAVCGIFVIILPFHVVGVLSFLHEAVEDVLSVVNREVKKPVL